MDYRINYAGMDVVFKINDIQNSYLRECVLDALKCFYGHFLQNVGEQPVAMTYRLTDHIDDHFDKNANNVSMTEAAKINDYQCFFAGHGNRFGYEFTNGLLSTIYYSVYTPGRVNNSKQRIVSRDFASNIEKQVAAMYTRGFLHPMQLVNLQNGGTFLHACGFSIGENGYIVAATPGAGKSSLLLSMAFSNKVDVHFISDDFSCIDAKGYAHQIGRSMAIKSHQIQYFPELKDKLQDMSFWQRMQWFTLKKRGLHRYAAPEDIYPNHIATNKKVSGIVYLTNHGKNTFEHTPMSVSDFADLNANMLFSELFLGIQIANNALIIPGYKNLKSVDAFISQTRITIEKIFKDVPCTLVKLPFRSDPRLAFEYLVNQKIIE